MGKITDDKDKAIELYEALTSSTGIDMAELDMVNIIHFVKKIINMFNLRTNLQNYLNNKMKLVAPNLTEILG